MQQKEIGINVYKKLRCCRQTKWRSVFVLENVLRIKNNENTVELYRVAVYTLCLYISY